MFAKQTSCSGGTGETVSIIFKLSATKQKNWDCSFTSVSGLIKVWYGRRNQI